MFDKWFIITIVFGVLNLLAVAVAIIMFCLQKKKRAEYQEFRKHKEKWFNNDIPMYGKMSMGLMPTTGVVAETHDNVILEEDT